MGWRLVIFCCFVTGVLAVSEGACGRFHVPPSQQVNAEEDTVVRFSITNTCNLGPDTTSVDVVKDDQNDAESKICRIRLNTADENSDCSCDQQGQSYSCQVKYRFPRQPEVRWELMGVPEGRIEQQVIGFNVTYPTVLTSFTIASSTNSVEVQRGVQIQLYCIWKDGNPQRDVRILNPHNKTLEQAKHKEGDSFFRFSLTNVQCNDSGLYRCEVADSGQSLSVSLLVRCVLKFRDTNANAHKKTVQLGSDARLQFAVHSYTAELQFCQLTHPSMAGFSCNSTRSEVMMKGTPPHLQLQLRLKNVMDEDTGTWQLQAQNGITSDSFPSVSFTLDVTAPTSISTTSSLAPGSEGGEGEGAEEPQEQGGTPWLYIGVGCVVVLILIIIVIVIYFGFLRPKRQRTAQGRRTAPRETTANAHARAGPSEDIGWCVSTLANLRSTPHQALSEGMKLDGRLKFNTTHNPYSLAKSRKMVTNDLYGMPDPCEMITNDLYGKSDDALPPGGNSAYEDMDSTGHRPCRQAAARADTGAVMETEGDGGGGEGGGEGEMYVGMEEIKKRKAGQKKSKTKGSVCEDAVMKTEGDGGEGGGEGEMYVGMEEIKKRKAGQRKSKTKGSVCEDAVMETEGDGGAGGGEGEMYVGMEEIKKRKAGQRKSKTKGSVCEDGH